jgi:hypothetical protein
MDKKAAEAQALKAKDNTGRALFESGKWADEDESGSDDDDDDVWNLQKLRKETEAIQNQKEEDRLLALYGGGAANGDSTPLDNGTGTATPQPQPVA